MGAPNTLVDGTCPESRVAIRKIKVYYNVKWNGLDDFRSVATWTATFTRDDVRVFYGGKLPHKSPPVADAIPLTMWMGYECAEDYIADHIGRVIGSTNITMRTSESIRLINRHRRASRLKLNKFKTI